MDQLSLIPTGRQKKIYVLFVCLGNICRSPMAEGIFRRLVQLAGLNEQIVCDSAGTSDYHIGELSDPRMRQTARKYGITLTHCARQLQASDFQKFHYLVAMDESNRKNIMAHRGFRPEYADRVLLLRQYDPEQPANLDVPDPYYGNQNGFEDVYQIIWRANRRFLQYLIEMHNLNSSLPAE